MSKKSPPYVLRGPKFSDRHQTYIPDAKDLILRLKDLPEVTYIRLGHITYIGRGKPCTRTKPIAVGLEVKFRGNSAVQHFFVHTKQPEKVKEAISESTN